MKEMNYWQQFMSTGSVKDYLNYRMESVQAADSGIGADSVVRNSTVNGLGENSYAGVCSSNRNDFKDGACR